MEKIEKGKIVEFRGSWMSGLATLVLRDDAGSLVEVPCENAATVRAFDACFGDVIADGHSVNQDAIKDKEIYWSYDGFGLVLGGFTPVDDASIELVEMYEEQHA